MATIFSGVMLGVMAEIAMDLTATITVSSGAVGAISSILTGKSVSGIMQTVTQQLGLGLILSTLLITVPPMAGFWFNGVMGSYSGYGVFDRSGALPAHVDGGRSHHQQVEQKANHHYQQITKQSNNPTGNINHVELGSGSGYGNISNTIVQSTDTLKSSSSQPPQSLQVRTSQPAQSKPEKEEKK